MMIKFEIYEGIIHAKFSHGPVLFVNESDEQINERLKIRSANTYPVLIDADHSISTTRELKAFLFEQGRHRISKSAVLLHTIFDMFFVRLYLLLDEPSVPTRVFRNEQEAKQWLKAL